MTIFKKVLAVLMVVTLTATAAIGGTLAYLQSEDSDVNVMTLGNVKIEQHEYERVVENDKYKEEDGSYVLKDFSQAKPLLPATSLDANGAPYNYGAGDYDATRVKMSQVDSHGSMDVFVNENAQDKFVTVENTGKSDAYVRTIIAYELGSVEKFDDVIMTSVFMTNEGVWKVSGIGAVEIDGNNYHVVEYIYNGAAHLGGVHENGVLPAGDTTYPSLSQVYMKATATNEDCEKIDGNGNGTYDILVVSQAIQAAGFADAETALDAGFGDITTTNHPWAGEGKAPVIPAVVSTADELKAALEAGGDVFLEGDIDLADTQITIPAEADVTLNLNGNSISATGLDAGSKKAVITNNGTLTLVGGTVESTGENGGSAVKNNGTLTVEGTTLVGAPNAGSGWPAYAVNNVGTMTLNNAKITSYHGAVCSYAADAVITLNNCEIDMAGIPGFTNHGIYTYNGGKVVVNGGTYANRAQDQNASGASVINGAVEINDGTFSGRIENYYGTPVLKGGTYSVNPNPNFVAAGYKVVDNGNGTWSVIAE